MKKLSFSPEAVKLELACFGGHLITLVKGVHDAQITPALSGGVSAAGS
ncbi:MAG: hypothetical protein FJY95_16645 [Candidatus Handelsmanbacteria bacterium]|nr:hypothetical protein [Candidatus Handelsmanbacteria bacterium]